MFTPVLPGTFSIKPEPLEYRKEQLNCDGACDTQPQPVLAADLRNKSREGGRHNLVVLQALEVVEGH